MGSTIRAWAAMVSFRSSNLKQSSTMAPETSLTGRFFVLGLLILWAIAAQSRETIRIGILHSTTGTMAISETALRDTMLMLIEDQNARGGILGLTLEPVIYDPRSNWGLYGQQARRMIQMDKVAVIFGCWTSASRKAVLPVVEELDGLLFYPLQYEGQESSEHIVYTGAVPNQQALPAIDFLRDSRGIERWILVGTDYVYPRTANRIITAYLSSLGVEEEDILLNYSPFGFQDWGSRVARFRRFATAGKKTAIVSTINGDANIGFFRQLQGQEVSASELPVLAFSIGEQEVAGIGSAGMEGHLAAWTYFMSVDTPANQKFIRRWRQFTGNADAVTSDPMEAHQLGFRLWLRAVESAGSAKASAVRRAILDSQETSLTGTLLKLGANNHLDKQAYIGQITSGGRIRAIWKSPAAIPARPWSEFLPQSDRGIR
jgi:urea transport system substrate-binding protein